jgi:glycosyltransferase involved in cell wall biosynthesis
MQYFVPLMKVAFVQDWFNANGGAEKVAGAILDIYDKEDIDIYALFDKFSAGARKEILKNKPVRTSVLQYVPFITKLYRYFLPFMPWLMKRFNLQGYDLIISTSHAVAKGFRSDPKTLNICYCHTPLRPIWDMYDDYAAHHWLGRTCLYKWYVHYLRRWDVASSKRVHYFIANSHHVQQRILNSYGRESKVIYPPVRVDKFTLNEMPRKNYYLCVGRVVPYKKMDMVVRAFQQMPERELVLIGEGWGHKQIHKLQEGHPNITWLGYKSDTELIKYVQEARACIFAAKEDFGIMCVEVQACGTPVLAMDYGGHKETVIDGETGYLFAEQSEQGVIEAVSRFEARPLTHYNNIRQNSLRFSEERFKKEFEEFVKPLTPKGEPDIGHFMENHAFDNN